MEEKKGLENVHGLEYKVRESMLFLILLLACTNLLLGGIGYCLISLAREYGQGEVFAKAACGGLCLLGSAFLIRQYCKSYWRVTEDGIEEYVGKKRKKALRWESCCFIGCYNERGDYGHTLICSRHMPQRTAEGSIPNVYFFPNKISVKLPWAWITPKARAQIKECVLASTAPQHVKDEFLSTIYK